MAVGYEPFGMAAMARKPQIPDSSVPTSGTTNLTPFDSNLACTSKRSFLWCINPDPQSWLLGQIISSIQIWILITHCAYTSACDVFSESAVALLWIFWQCLSMFFLLKTEWLCVLFFTTYAYGLKRLNRAYTYFQCILLHRCYQLLVEDDLLADHNKDCHEEIAENRLEVTICFLPSLRLGNY